MEAFKGIRFEDPIEVILQRYLGSHYSEVALNSQLVGAINNFEERIYETLGVTRGINIRTIQAYVFYIHELIDCLLKGLHSSIIRTEETVKNINSICGSVEKKVQKILSNTETQIVAPSQEVLVPS